MWQTGAMGAGRYLQRVVFTVLHGRVTGTCKRAAGSVNSQVSRSTHLCIPVSYVNLLA